MAEDLLHSCLCPSSTFCFAHLGTQFVPDRKRVVGFLADGKPPFEIAYFNYAMSALVIFGYFMSV